MTKHSSLTLAIGFFSVLALPEAASADNFADAHYDAAANELVVTLRYRGTNPDHNFALQWGKCLGSADGSAKQRIDATITDDQWNDAARQDYKKTARFSLADLACRPAWLTLHTAPRYYWTLQIPAAP